ncbi:hypothetical protein Skr01_56760 [Sphaerisporangium krabiense]|nr:hypothetical protein Skr01_56760 [Sphaerisporangium krabiense]
MPDSTAVWTWIERIGWLAGLISTVFAGVTLARDLSEPAAAPNASSAGPSPSPAVKVSRNSYTLHASSWISTNDRDKVDLDTGHPGHGRASLQVGPARDGGPAEIILEDDSIHGADPKVSYTLTRATTYAACAAALAREGDHLTEIPLDRLGPGSRFCVTTDEKRLSLVRVVARNSETAELVIAFTTWTARPGE